MLSRATTQGPAAPTHRVSQVLGVELGQAGAGLAADATHQLVCLDAQLAQAPQRVGQGLQGVESTLTAVSRGSQQAGWV